MVCSCKDSVCCCSDSCSCSTEVCSCSACLHIRNKEDGASTDGNKNITDFEKEGVLKDILNKNQNVREDRAKKQNSPLPSTKRCSQNLLQKNNSSSKKTFHNPPTEVTDKSIFQNSATILKIINKQGLPDYDDSASSVMAIDARSITSLSAFRSFTTLIKRTANRQLMETLLKENSPTQKRSNSPSFDEKDYSTAKRNKFQSSSNYAHLQRHGKENIPTQVSGSESGEHIPYFIDVSGVENAFIGNDKRLPCSPQNISIDNPMPLFNFTIPKNTPEKPPSEDFPSFMISPIKNDFKPVMPSEDRPTDDMKSCLSPGEVTENQKNSFYSPRKQSQPLKHHAGDQINSNESPIIDVVTLSPPAETFHDYLNTMSSELVSSHALLQLVNFTDSHKENNFPEQYHAASSYFTPLSATENPKWETESSYSRLNFPVASSFQDNNFTDIKSLSSSIFFSPDYSKPGSSKDPAYH